MRSAALVLVALVALLHLWFLVLEMFLWRSQAGRVFGLSAEQVEATAQLAANQGLYNGFLAAGPGLGALLRPPARPARHLLPPLRAAAGGIYGGLTVKRVILLRAGPARTPGAGRALGGWVALLPASFPDRE